MNKIEKLLQQLCPDGVEFKALGEVGEFANIGVDKKIIAGQKEITLLNFVDIMRNKYIDKSIPQMKVTASDTKIEKCTCEKGDIFITPSSETIDEIGFASVVVETIPNACYSYHIMRFRLFKHEMVTSFFIRYLFEGGILRSQIRKYAIGLTRFGLSKDKWNNLKIPIPPLKIQKEIVSILDAFTELEAELEARRKQYEHYRERLLSFDELVSRSGGGGHSLK